jgi:GPH family glycoside/pentoside/hexuronide:cation symporter
VWGLAVKISEALGIVVSGWVLQLFGYMPNVEQSAQTLLGIRLFFGPVPLILFTVALPLLIWYPITRKSHAELLKRLEAMEM